MTRVSSGPVALQADDTGPVDLCSNGSIPSQRPIHELLGGLLDLLDQPALSDEELASRIVRWLPVLNVLHREQRAADWRTTL